jgi:D-amino peptidase
LEGITGVVSLDQLNVQGFEYERFRRIMTDEVLAAIHGAEQIRPSEFVVADSHGNGESIIVEDLPANVRLVRGAGRPLGMMEGILDSHFDAAMLIGFHAGATNGTGVLFHTEAGKLTELSLNGTSASEGYIAAAVAAHAGVPIVLVSGDDAALQEMRILLGGAQLVSVKRAIGYESAETLTPAAAQVLIWRAAGRAMKSLSAQRPPNIADGPQEIRLTFKNVRPPEVLSWLPVVKRTGSRSISYQAADIIEAEKFIQFALEYSPDLTP